MLKEYKMEIIKKTLKSTLILMFGIFFVANLEANASSRIKFAVIGDYGECDEESGMPYHSSANVAMLVKSWDPDFIVTTGDNNYPKGEYKTIDINVGFLYSSYIYPYIGTYDQPVIKQNRFFPCLGNHEFDTGNAQPYLSYFTMPELGNKYYYDFVRGDVHFFALCSDERGCNIPDQLIWLEEKVKHSELPWKIVYFHHPAYSSEILAPCRYRIHRYEKNQERKIHAPFSEWGVSAVLNAHIHVYERFMIDGIPYITCGLGGGKVFYEFCDENPDANSIKRFTGENGAICVEATDREISFKFITTSGTVIDEITMIK